MRSPPGRVSWDPCVAYWSCRPILSRVRRTRWTLFPRRSCRWERRSRRLSVSRRTPRPRTGSIKGSASGPRRPLDWTAGVEKKAYGLKLDYAFRDGAPILARAWLLSRRIIRTLKTLFILTLYAISYSFTERTFFTLTTATATEKRR